MGKIRNLCVICGKELMGKQKKFCSPLCRFKGGSDDRHNRKIRKFDDEKYRKNEQLCWTCQKATGFCSWSRRLKPVKGWEAKPIKLKVSGGLYVDSYKILCCPEYKRDERR